MINHAKNIALALLVLCLTVTLPGCKKDQESPGGDASQNAPAPVRQQTVVSPVPVVPTLEAGGDQVSFIDKKDPFKPYVVDATRSLPPKRNKLGIALPILNYEVSQFQLKGVIVGLKENTAMVLDPTGKPYVVKAGMEIGRNEGKITKITSNHVEVFEQYRDESGRLIKNIIKLTLPKKE